MLTRNKFQILFPVVMTILLILTVSISYAAGIETKAQWDSAYQSLYANGEPMLDITNANEDGRFAWEAHYWIRAYVTMAETYSDSSYMDKAVRLIDFVLANRDDARYARGEIDIKKEPYYTAPQYYLNHRDEAAPGWRIWDSYYNGWRDLIVCDGQITNAIMRFVDLVYSNSTFSSYKAKADEYMAKVEETVKAHDSSFVFNRFDDIPGSYYYPDPDGSGLYSGAVEFNMDATMGVTLLLLDKVKGGVPDYHAKAEAILEYFKKHAWTNSNNAYVWYYHPQKPWIGTTSNGTEDFNHAHMDLGFLILAYKQGLNITLDDMKKFANTLVKNMYRGNGELAWSVDGKDDNTDQNYWPAGFDWIDLTEFDPQVLNIAKEVYNKYYESPGWARPFLGWAEILHWSQQDAIPAPPKNLRIESTS